MDLRELRVRLNQMTERIVSRLKDRSRFPLNDPVYLPNGVPIQGHDTMSLLEFALLGLETYHASLGRYAYPDQHPLVLSEPVEAPTVRTIGQQALPAMQIAVKDDLLTFYVSMLRELCAEGTDADTYGETAYVDADLVQLLNERVNVGRYVAQVKLDADPRLMELANDAHALDARLRDATREAELFAAVREAATRYQVDVGVTEHVFRWIVDETTRVEVEYIQRLSALE